MKKLVVSFLLIVTLIATVNLLGFLTTKNFLFFEFTVSLFRRERLTFL